MSERIYAAVPEHFIRRMRNWAYASADDAQDYTVSRIYSLGSGVRYPESRVPLLIGEAEDTSRALSLLPIRYRQAVSLFWQYEDRPLSWFAMRSGTGVDGRIFEQRVIDGHQLLQAELVRQAEQIKRYREAVQERKTEKESPPDWAKA